MRHVSKQGFGTGALSKAHGTPPSTPESASTRCRSFRRHKVALLEQLLDEQYGLCCYSEIRPDQYNLNCHIEHVENKSQQPRRTFDYTNLAASALDSEVDLPTFKRLGNEAFGGHARGKSNGVDMTRFIACHQVDCAIFGPIAEKIIRDKAL